MVRYVFVFPSVYLPSFLSLKVRSVEQQVVLERVKRVYSPPTDEKWPQQWYLVRYLLKHQAFLVVERGGVISRPSCLTFNLRLVHSTGRMVTI